MLQPKFSSIPFLLLFTLLFLQVSSRNYTDLFLGNLKQNQGIIFNSESEGDFLGYSGDYAGDFNGDGFPDIIMGASGARAHAGDVYVIFGSKNGPSKLTLIP